MQNRISNRVNGVIFQGQRTFPAVVTNRVALGFSETDTNGMTQHLTSLDTARATHADKKVELAESRIEFKDHMKAGREFASSAREALKPFLGREMSVAWIEAGFVGNFEVPRNTEDLVRVLQALKKYLTDNPTHENPVMNVTANRADTLATDILNGLNTRDQKEGALVTAKADRDAKMKVVRADLRTVLSKLKISFGPFDAMWETLGFNRPGFESTPEVPQNVVILLTGPNSASIKWNAAARAGHYRVWKKVVGVDEDFVAVGSPADLDFTLEGLPGNATIQIAVSAVNTGGESAKSDAVTVVTV